MIKIYITESERGWGSKVEYIKKFDTKDLAQAYIDEFNCKNDKETVPDWYMYATF